MDPAPHLSTLPAEILQLIIDQTHPSGHWPLAQTCRYLYQNSERVLNLHREAYRNFRITSDLDPITVFNLLWSVFSHGVAHIDAWHVREFEVWGERDPGWGEDSEADSDIDEDSEVDSNPDEALLDERSEALPWSPPEFDIDYFCEELLKVPDFFPKTDEQQWGEHVRYGLETGRETITKSLMLVHLPRIRAIRCAKAGRERHPWVEMLCEYIYWCKAAGTWLPGLETLEKVFVSIPPDGGYRRLNTGPDEFAALLCLPNLSEVYFAHLDGDFELSDLGVDLFTNGPQAPFDKTSPVRTIILDHLENSLSKKLISFLAKMPHALQNIAIRFQVIYDHEERSRSAASLAEALSEHQCKSLQRVCFDADIFPDWPFFMPGLDLKVMRLFDDLRVVKLDWPGVEMSLAESDENLPREELLDRLYRLFQLCLPNKMEILVLNLFEETAGVLLTGELARGNRDNLGYVDEAIEAAIKSTRYDNLKAVMLGYIQISLQHTAGGDWYFPKAVKAAEERGIYIGLKGDVPPPGLGLDGTFVPVPTRSCMVTGRLRTE
ncbi:unnamed protein product [Clonostachys byssicola]|uniref:F-box domain-containing protein n=1 Tax=Clonostachys byssicola TaxID=160290 RepID=A0A9N9U3F6_9HYPO|nr:unnamed protein product [Clonostachys byssicola]